MTDYDRETVRETTVVDQVPADPYVPDTRRELHRSDDRDRRKARWTGTRGDGSPGGARSRSASCRRS